ncbi:unnamed protein product [Protopolystoma xenopodis]|uniref:Uncharacterized protein n=1 Tax=Protopolystoma xenopodis TaxID=117903 RepID=A0A3S5B6M2_9PLAT|nr:unnamed protein product [Protopolystoma xenopodis]
MALSNDTVLSESHFNHLAFRFTKALHPLRNFEATVKVGPDDDGVLSVSDIGIIPPLREELEFQPTACLRC